MNRFYGEVGYGETVENPAGSGKWSPVITEFPYQGDVVRNLTRQEAGDKVNNDISVSNSISVLADEYAMQNSSKIKYVRWNGVRWIVTSVEIRHPRLILNLGSVYNGPTPATP